VIDRYELIEEIGEGGMGSVWRAHQSEPVKRDVAFKIIKLGMDTKEVVVRFEAERQALALMDHPHIAKVLDGGATDSGRPYFVMELVEGVPITDYCDDAKLDVRQRLELFAKVCEGIQHAHQKGLIHRDIKPGNVLVALQDGEPVPKVIDFGIAKATGESLTEKTMHTELGQMLGTPEYMAPEQLGMSGLDIDTRADVYSLGVLLYELLTGTKPFDIQKIVEAGYDELLRTIREVDPEKPSTRITNLDDTQAIAELRQLDVRALGKQLSGDLDWVVMKALEKDRARRYETANGFAADVQRFLDQEPVVAAPPSATYRLRKFVKRRKKTVAAMATIAFLLIAGSIGTGIGLWRTIQAKAELGVALDEKDTALKEEERQRTLAQENEARAKEAEGEAKARATELEQVAAFQSSQLSELDPELMGVRLRRNLIDATPEDRRAALTAHLAGLNFTNLALQTLEENLFERTIEAIETQFAQQPLVQAQLLSTVGETLFNLGLLDLSLDPIQRALVIHRSELGDDHPGTLMSVGNVGRLLKEQGRLDEAQPHYREALNGLRRVLGDDHPDTLLSINNMGALLQSQGRLDEAQPYYREALDGRRRVLGDDHPHSLLSVGNMGSLLRDLGRLDEAEFYYREALDGKRRVLGDDHPSTLASVNNMGFLLRDLGRLDEVEPYYREALDERRRVLGDDHPSTLESVTNMGILLQEQGRVDEAEPYYREALDGKRRVLGDDHHDTLASVNNMGFLLRNQGRVDEAEPYYREALDGRRRVLGDDHPSTLGSLNNMGFLLQQLGRLDEAEPYYREALDSLRRVLGDDHPDTLVSVDNMSFLLQAQGRVDEAEPYCREALDGRRRVLGGDHPDTLLSVNNMSRLLHTQVTRARQEKDDHQLASALASLGAFQLESGMSAVAEAQLAEAMELLVTTGSDESRLQRVLGDLGAAVAAQGRHADAEPMLMESAEWMLEHPTDPAAGTGIQRMVDFYEAWHATEPEQGNDALAAEWRGELERWRAKDAAEDAE